MSVLWTLVRRTLDRAAALLLTVAALLALFQMALIAVAAALADAGGFDRLESLAPAFVAQIMGPAMTSFGGMAALSFFEPLIVVLVVQVAIYLAAEPAGDVEGGLVDLLMARPLPRHLLVTRTLLVMTGAVVLLPAAMAASMWVGLLLLAPAGAPWPHAARIAVLTAHLSAVGWCFGGVALAAGAWARRRGQAQAAVGIAAVALYLMEGVGEAWPRHMWLARLSPFHHFHGSSVLAGLTNPAFDLGVLAAIGIAGVAVAYWQFARRDI